MCLSLEIELHPNLHIHYCIRCIEITSVTPLHPSGADEALVRPFTDFLATQILYSILTAPPLELLTFQYEFGP
jgi:hypothetical protein